MQKKYALLLLIWFHLCSNAQNHNFRLPDSLSAKGYNYFTKRINYNERDSIRERLYTLSWLAKAKSEENFHQMALAYKMCIYQFDKKWSNLYIDNAIAAAKQTTDVELIGSLYITKGILYYERKELMKALDNYLIANQYISKTNNEYLVFKAKYCIAQTKSYLGYYHEAIALFKECITYLKDVNDRAYLNSLHSLGLCYNKIGKYQLCDQINKIGLDACQQLKIKEMVSYFLLSEGINQYFKYNYIDSGKKLRASLPVITANKDFANQTMAYFYMGKNYWSLNQKEKAISYFKKVDEIFVKQNYTRPELREAYDRIIDYYVQQKDQEGQLVYSRKLLKIDRILETNYKYLSGKIVKEYDTQELEKFIVARENASRLKSHIPYYSLIVILIIVILFLIYRQYKNKRLFNELMNSQPELVIENSYNNQKETELDINPEVVATILSKLEKFENDKKYLEKEMNSSKLASLLDTNTRYVSKIILKYRNKSLIDYVRDLKTDHIVHLLKTENKYRNYTNKALGEEAGFGTTQSFTKAFNTRTGISPSYFIKELNKSKSVD